MRTLLLTIVVWVWVLPLGALPFWAAPVWAAGPAWDKLADGGRARVAAVVDGDTIALEDGRQVRLVGIQAPKLPLGRAGFEKWPLADEAKQRLQQLVLGQTVTLRLGTQPVDRHGRVLAHVIREADALHARAVWAQGQLLAEGLARVYTFPDNRLLAAEMLALERAARRAHRGIWAEPFYTIRTPDTVLNDVSTFQLVEGTVYDVSKYKDRTYLNFGKFWRTDFTIKVPARAERAFTAAGIDLTKLTDRRVRVRGWIKDENGPMIELDHPERLELLD